MAAECEISGVQYAGEAEPLRRWLHRLIEAEERGEVAELLREPPPHALLPLLWHSHVLPEMEAHFERFLRRKQRWPYQPSFHLWISKWMDLGVAITSFRAGFCEDLLVRLLGVIRDAQDRWGRIPKGAIYHQIGWARLAERESEALGAAERFFVLAALEDLLNEEDAVVDAGSFRSLPAYRTLISTYGKPERFFEHLQAQVRKDRDYPSDRAYAFARANPELLVLRSSLRERTITPS